VSKIALTSTLLALASVTLFVPAPACTSAASPAAEGAVGTATSALTDAGGGGVPDRGSIVISQVYGGGGSPNASFTNDFVELLNRTKAPLALDGLSLQVAGPDTDFGSGDPTTSILALHGTVGAGEYVLIALDSAAPGDGQDLTADLSGALILGETVGKVALANGTAPLGCGGIGKRCAATKVLDMIGYGLVSDFEGTQFVKPLDNQSSAIRKGNGCTDTDKNSDDFDVVHPPAPRNAVGPKADCPATQPPPKDGGTKPPPGPTPPVVDPPLGPDVGDNDAGQARDAGPRQTGGASSDCSVAVVGNGARTSFPVAVFLSAGLVLARLRRRARREVG
jgi:hypothetical protein